jgi:hypothetical protein
MLLQKTVLAPHLGPVLASACELEYQILLLVAAHPQAKKLGDDYRKQMLAKNGYPRLSKFLSILMSSSGLRDPQEVAYLRGCLNLRNLLVHGAYRGAILAVASLPQLEIKRNVVTFSAARGFSVPACETQLEEAMMLVRVPWLGPLVLEIFDGAHLLLSLRVDQYYGRKHKLSTPMMTIGDYPGPNQIRT